jgi:aromatic-L-amino-acid decarboxylase
MSTSLTTSRRFTPIDERLTTLRQRIEQPLPHPSIDDLQAATDLLRDWTLHHHLTLADQPIGHTPSPAYLAQRLTATPSEQGKPFTDVLQVFREVILPNTLKVGHPRFLAFIPGSPSYPSILGDWLTSAANLFGGVWLEGAAAAQIETMVLDWFRQWLGLPPSTRGTLTSGGSEANLTALVVARQRLSFNDRNRAVLYVSEQRHRSIDRAAMVIGLQPSQIRPVPVDGDYRLDRPALAKLVVEDRAQDLLPWVVVANAGSTNTGAVDPLPEIASLCQEEGIWLHVDAAYGWSAILAHQGKQLLAGIEAANSVTLDPHKWFAQTYEAGCLLVRDGARLPETFAMRPDYLQDAVLEVGEVNYADNGIPLSRRFRALKIWLSIQMLGLDWYRQLAEHGLTLAEYAQSQLLAEGFQMLAPRQLGIVCFRYPFAQEVDELNQQIVRLVRETGEAILSSTRLKGDFALRLCFVNWRTTANDVDRVVELLLHAAQQASLGNSAAGRDRARFQAPEDWAI